MIFKKDNLFTNFIKLYFFFFPFFLISGSFLPDLFVTTTVVFLFFFFTKISYKNVFSNNFFIFLIIIYIYININSALSDFPIISFQTSIPYLRFILFSFILCFFLDLIKDLKKIIIFSFLAAYLVLLADSSFQLIFGHNILGMPLHDTNRVSSFFGSKLVMGSFVARTIPIVIAIIFFENLKYKEFTQVIILIVAGILIFFSGERVSFSFYLITCVFYFFLNYKKKYFILIIFCFFIFFSFLSLLKPSSFKRLIISTIEQSAQTKNIFFFSYRHELHYLTAYNMFKDRKFLGHGIKSFRYLCDKDKYVPLNKIEIDNRIYAPNDSYIFFENIHGKNFYYFKASLLDEFNASASIEYHGLFQIKYKKNGEFVKKGEPILSSYEFINGCNTHPHSIHLQFLSELGIFGYVFLLFSFVFLFYNISVIILKYLKNNKLHEKELSLFFAMLGIFISILPIFPSGNFFNNWLSVIFYFNMSFLIYFFKKN
jgi:O-antigen ligase